MKTIILTKEKAAWVDDEDFEWISQWKWSAMWNGWNWYAYRRHRGKSIYMHRIIMNALKGIHIDHENGNTLDNRKCNLRFATTQQNAANMRVHRSNNTSGSKGVRWEEDRKRWFARIHINGKTKNLGRYHYKKDAEAAYKNAAREAFGKFART